MLEYYELRAGEYDATTYELAAGDARAAQDLRALEELLASLPAARTLDVGCGTGWLTRLLPGEIVGVDQSAAMLDIARSKMPRATFLRAVVPPLPFADRAFERVVASHLCSHLEDAARLELVGEAMRVAPQLVVVEQAWQPGLPVAPVWEERRLRDGSIHPVYKRYFTAQALADELGGAILLDTAAFIVVCRSNTAAAESMTSAPV